MILLNLLMSIAFAQEISILQIDTGVSLSHTEIKKHVTDLEGFNYQDFNGHGTHIAGLILKDTCSQVKLYSCRFFDDDKSDEALYLNCLTEMGKREYDFVNMSAGGTDPYLLEYSLLKYALEGKKTTFVVAAGNDYKNLGSPCFGYFPACYRFDNMIVVGNLDVTGQKKDSSDWGVPEMQWEMGTEILSTAPGPYYERMTGTSQAAAIRTNRLVKKKCMEINH